MVSVTVTQLDQDSKYFRISPNVKIRPGDVAFFAEHLEKYNTQHKMARHIAEKRPIGMLLVDATKMKSLLIPSPLRCLDVSG
ncbi:dynein heavy chain 6, axonemal-like [Elysia marginata]|uniref:Dynein heavy chain 6, axonemal-like n=1 Tax=Elysia marginata TaxID=1093978 RepID=A0AAV4FB01_9GAST|nr:dynein heavy chain 6, axonemal-like [Elysia marginata]